MLNKIRAFRDPYTGTALSDKKCPLTPCTKASLAAASVFDDGEIHTVLGIFI